MFYDYTIVPVIHYYAYAKEEEEESEQQDEDELQDFDALKRERVGILEETLWCYFSSLAIIFSHMWQVNYYCVIEEIKGD